MPRQAQTYYYRGVKHFKLAYCCRSQLICLIDQIYVVHQLRSKDYGLFCYYY